MIKCCATCKWDMYPSDIEPCGTCKFNPMPEELMKDNWEISNASSVIERLEDIVSEDENVIEKPNKKKKKKRKCVWYQISHDETTTVNFESSHDIDMIIGLYSGENKYMKYCPYCGRKIKLKMINKEN